MTKWDKFSRQHLLKIFQEKKSVIDIGGGLRFLKERGNRYDSSMEWMRPYFEKVDYKILDPVSDYHPDIVGDIHHLPFEDNSQEAILCIAVLEHVENPFKAVEELHRVLRPGGHLFVYVPFLYYYHAERGYYRDYWRFSEDAVDLLFKGFSRHEMARVRGPLATWLHISPLGRIWPLAAIFRALDRLLGKENSHQTSGFYVFLVK